MMPLQVALPVEEQSQVAGARRRTALLLAPLGFGETASGRIALAVTEIATNLLKHAGRGVILLRALERGGTLGLEVIGLDRGPGIPRLAESMRDGVSTAGSLGTGLGALARSSQSFEIYSQPARGTALRLEFWPAAVPAPGGELELGVVCLAMPGEDVSGDGWAVRRHGACHVALVADGLGHGPAAASASRAAELVLEEHPELAPQALLERMHGPLAKTRGAAVSVARIDPEREIGLFSGIGNVAGIVFDAEQQPRHLVSYNGIVGHRFAALREFAFPFLRGSLLILHSDGLATRWDVSDYPGLLARHAGLIAAVLYRDFDRGRDDVTVLALRASAEK